MSIAIIALTAPGAHLARRLAAALPEASVHLPRRLAPGDGAEPFDALAEELPRLFAARRGLVCIMAAGIVVRVLAPHLKGKDTDPAVVVVDEAGRYAISLLSGHLGGANALAAEVAEKLGGQAVITTASDVRGLPAWDEVARREGLALEPVANLAHLNGALLRGEPIALVDPQRRIAAHYAGIPGVERFDTVLEAQAFAAAGRVYVTHRLVPDLEGQGDVLLVRPRDLVLGIGCKRGTAVEEIEAVVRETLEQAFLSRDSVRGVASIRDKQDEAGLLAFAERLGVPLTFFSAEQLNAVDAPTPPAAVVLDAVGAKGVSEPAALLAAAPGRLLVRKQKSGNVTVAVAEMLYE